MKNNKLFFLLLSLVVVTFACKNEAKEQSDKTEEVAETAQKTPPVIEVSGPKTYKVKVKKKSVGDDDTKTATTPCVPTATCFCTETETGTSGMYIQADLELQNTVATSATDVTFTFFYKQNGRWARQMSTPPTYTLPAVGTERPEDTGDMLLYNSEVFPDTIRMQVNPPNTIGNTGQSAVVLIACPN